MGAANREVVLGVPYGLTYPAGAARHSQLGVVEVITS